MVAMMKRVLGDETLGGNVFLYRRSGGEHSVAQRKQGMATLGDLWGDGKARIFNPPLHLAEYTSWKTRMQGAREIVVMPLTLELPAHAALRRMADRVHVLEVVEDVPLVVEARSNLWRTSLLVGEVGLADVTKLDLIREAWRGETRKRSELAAKDEMGKGVSGRGGQDGEKDLRGGM